MEKRAYWWIVCCALGVLLMGHLRLSAQEIQAKEFALNWMKEQTSSLKSSPALSDFKLLSSDEPNLYLAEFEPKGFLIYFYKDNDAEIIGYSSNALFPNSPNHPLIKEWIPLIKTTADSRLKSTKGVSFMNDTRVEPLIEASWGQGSPWNKYCPTDDDGKHALVGCVAVAMGQVMHKWNWPERGLGSNSYTPTNHPEYGIQTASFDTAYQWLNMHRTYPDDASALLLYHAGVATYMNYGPDESGANTSVYATQALKNNFRFYKGLQIREKERYSEKDWFIMLRQELINGRPLIYIGSNPDGGSGHAFNIDGFHSKSYFHFNWGWNGAGNGYFRLENMAAGGGNFTKGQAAIFWLQPDNIPMHDRPGAFQSLPGDSFVQLLWDELVINDFSHYNIYRDGELIATPVTTSFRDLDLENGRSYSYHISASYIGSDEGESEPTDNIEAMPVPGLTLPFENGFELIPNEWELKNTLQGFRWGSAADLDIPGNNGHVVSIRSDQADPASQVSDYLISPSLDIRNIDNVAISFDYAFKQKPGVDHLFVMYRRYDNGLWYPISKLDSTGAWSDWETVYFYFPEEAKYGPIQIGFYYNDFNGQGYGAAIDNIRIWEIDEPPIPEYSVNDSEACQFQRIIFTSESSGDISSWYWNFGEGAEPEFAFTEGPHEVSYNTGGSKSTTLLLNHLDLLEKDHQIHVTLEPIAGFETSTDGLLAEFNDTSKNGNYYWWDFGDGKTSSEKNPQNKYQLFEQFTVTQVVYNDHCQPDTMRMDLDFRINSALESTTLDEGFLVYPNPARGKLYIKFLLNQHEPIHLQLFNLQGKLVIEHKSLDIEYHLNISSLEPGIYLLKTRSGKHRYTKKIIIE
ncbi:MAG: C10 family peptidase [Bacteroidales bacterium]|nr:C10 family peptidase [Bacteroidales bacterium]